MTRRILYVIVVICMVLALMPAHVAADGDVGIIKSGLSDYKPSGDRYNELWLDGTNYYAEDGYGIVILENVGDSAVDNPSCEFTYYGFEDTVLITSEMSDFHNMIYGQQISIENSNEAAIEAECKYSSEGMKISFKRKAEGNATIKVTFPYVTLENKTGEKIPDGNENPDGSIGSDAIGFVWQTIIYRVCTSEEDAILYGITALADEGGTITPSGNINVYNGEDAAFTITPDNGYEIADVKVDGISVGSVSTYTFEDVKADHTITAAFERIEDEQGETEDDENNGGSPGIIILPYTLAYETNGAGEIESETEFFEWTKPYEDLPVPSLDGYIFDGWYYDEELTELVDGDVAVDALTVTLYAAWSLDESDPDNNGVSDLLDSENHMAYLNGYPNESFKPQNNMTRAEAAQMFYNLLVNKDVMITVEFDDVADDAWYATAVNTLASMGILKGIGIDADGNNLYAPEAPITRAEFTAIAMRFSKLDVEGENIFSDVDEDAWYYEYVVGSVKYGWINGYPDGTFRPDSTITRAEVTAITNRMLGRAADEDYVDANSNILREFTDLDISFWAYYDIVEATNSHEYTTENGIESWQ